MPCCLNNFNNKGMRPSLLKTKKILAITSGILFSAMLVGSFSEKMTMELAEAHQTGDDSTNNISISETVLAATEVNIHEDTNIAEVEKEPEYVPDPQKVENIRKYLVGRNSPLADYAIEFVKASDYYGIDYRFVAAISIIESNGGNRCFKPYNAWGWGKMTFQNWTDGIWTVSKGIATYYQNGLTTPKLISTYYCPPSAESWASKVQFVMNEIGI